MQQHHPEPADALATTTTLAQLGLALPVGTEPEPDALTRSRGYAFKPWRSSDERAIGALRDKNRSMSHGAYASEILCHFLTSWGHHDFAAMDPKAKRLVLNQSWAADVYAAWMQLRRQVLGDTCTLSVTCNLCRAEFPYDVDLGTMDVRVVPDGTPVTRPFRLRDGFDWRGETHTAGILRPVRWDVYENMGKGGGNLNMGDMKLALLASAVTGLGAAPTQVRLPATALDLTKFDLENLTQQVDESQPGPDLSVADNCPECGSAFTRSIPWTYDSFFSVRASSRGAALAK